MAREALGIVGGAVGFIVGGPVGASIGYSIGSAIGGLLEGPTRVPAPGLAEAPIQTSRDGVPIPIIRGVHECHGNLIQKNPEVIVTTTERQGKGGGGTEVETKQRFRTYAIGIAEPFVEITRIWRNGKLVYDTRSSPAIPAAETAKYAQKITIYYGDEAQLPDPELEAHWGAADTPAYRGLGYIVHVDDDLTDIGGAIPSFRFELNGSRDLSITSKPYPIEATDGILPAVAPGDKYIWTPPLEGVEPSVSLRAGTLGGVLHQYEYEIEGVDTTVTLPDGTLEVLLHQYTYPTEGVDPAVALPDGTLEVLLIQYDYDTEGIDPTVTLKDGTLA